MIRKAELISLVVIMLASWVVMSQHVQQREEQGRLFLQARPPKVNHRGYRGQLTVPQAFAGLRVSPSVYRWMLGHYGATGVSRMGVTVAEKSDPSLNRRVMCCSEYLGEVRSARSCMQGGGGCCAREMTNYTNSAVIGLINPKNLLPTETSAQGYQGNCWQCYQTYSYCLIGN